MDFYGRILYPLGVYFHSTITAAAAQSGRNPKAFHAAYLDLTDKFKQPCDAFTTCTANLELSLRYVEEPCEDAAIRGGRILNSHYAFSLLLQSVCSV